MTTIIEKFPIGCNVKIKHTPGDWIIKSHNKDGSIGLYGGTNTHKSFRDVLSTRLRVVTSRKK